MSDFSYALRVSGLIGLTIGFGVQLYTAVLQDPIIYREAQLIPGWLSTVSTTLLIGSLAVLVYGQMIDEVVMGWIDLVALCAIGGQWATPIGVYLSATLTAGTPAGLLTLVGYALHALVAGVMSIAYARHGRA